MPFFGHTQHYPAKKNPLAPTHYAQIEKERDRLFDELQQLRQVQGTSSQALETVRLLLTRQWIKADWRGRERLNKAANWMLRVELHGSQSSA